MSAAPVQASSQLASQLAEADAVAAVPPGVAQCCDAPLLATEDRCLRPPLVVGSGRRLSPVTASHRSHGSGCSVGRAVSSLLHDALLCRGLQRRDKR